MKITFPLIQHYSELDRVFLQASKVTEKALNSIQKVTKSKGPAARKNMTSLFQHPCWALAIWLCTEAGRDLINALSADSESCPTTLNPQRLRGFKDTEEEGGCLGAHCGLIHVVWEQGGEAILANVPFISSPTPIDPALIFIEYRQTLIHLEAV